MPVWADVGNNPLNFIIFAGAVIAALAVLFGAARIVTRFIRRIVHFLDDWQGSPERPGIPAQPGVMERLQVVEDRTKQLKPNGGSHLADTIAVIEARGAAIENRVAEIADSLGARDAQLDHYERLRVERDATLAAIHRRLDALEGEPEPAPAPPPARPRRARRSTGESQAS